MSTFSSAVIDSTEAPQEPVALSAFDRCDVCGAQARVRVTLVTGELLFCAHHARKNSETIERVAVSVQDETAKLYAEQ